MAKETIIAKLRGKLDFTEEAQAWLQQQEVWFARDGGQAFFSEMRGSFSHAFADISQTEIDAYFREFELPPDQRPHVQNTGDLPRVVDYGSRSYNGWRDGNSPLRLPAAIHLRTSAAAQRGGLRAGRN